GKFATTSKIGMLPIKQPVFVVDPFASVGNNLVAVFSDLTNPERRHKVTFDILHGNILNDDFRACIEDVEAACLNACAVIVTRAACKMLSLSLGDIGNCLMVCPLKRG